MRFRIFAMLPFIAFHLMPEKAVSAELSYGWLPVVTNLILDESNSHSDIKNFGWLPAATNLILDESNVQPDMKIFGWADLHAHPFAYEGFGGNGSVFYGKAYGSQEEALPHCDAQHGIGGINDLIGMVMHRQYTIARHADQLGHKTDGSPQFSGWPRWDDVTHQSMHEDWLKRAVDGGMRLMVALAVNNEWMCATAKGVDMTVANLAIGAAFATGGPPAAIGAAVSIIGTQIALTQLVFLGGKVPEECKDMPSVSRQINEAYNMQNSIDARNGGTGQGWFRIVKNPEEAIEVMRQGKLAVVLGIEVDNLFGCYQNGSCTKAWVRSQLDHYFALGVRHIFPIHFYDNAFGGSSNSNFLITNQFKNPMQKIICPAFTSYSYDNNQCNALGLTDLGNFLINELALRGMIIDTDHMSTRAFKDALDILEPMNYPAVSGHSGFNEINRGDSNHEGNRNLNEVQRIMNSNGMVSIIPHQGNLDQILTSSHIAHTCGNSSETVAQAYLYAIQRMPGQPVGLGTDFNGFAGAPGPRFGEDACPGGFAPGFKAKQRLNYPFTISTKLGTVSLDRGSFGQRTYDFNIDGLAHIGLVPDMIADWQALGMSSTELEPLFDSAAGYVRVWNRARISAQGFSGTRMMTVLFPKAIKADKLQNITIYANDMHLDFPISGGEVWIDNIKVANLGQTFTRNIKSYEVPMKCTWVNDDVSDKPHKECEPAYRAAEPLKFEVRVPNYENAYKNISVEVE